MLLRIVSQNTCWKRLVGTCLWGM